MDLDLRELLLLLLCKHKRCLSAILTVILSLTLGSQEVNAVATSRLLACKTAGMSSEIRRCETSIEIRPQVPSLLKSRRQSYVYFTK